VKNVFRKAALINLILLYGFVVSLYSGSVSFENKFPTEQQRQPQAESINSASSKNLFSHTTRTESSVNLVTSVPNSSYKTRFTDFLKFIKTTDQLSLAKFLQYGFFSKHILLRLCQYDIVFPFHYFW
jgi:hypothetical protein